ncbi:hypothetical protein Gogos_002838 [Gossypium gossypioides]|uniref:Uncharacterized protein n=1 Tax=Gossypium gossypioides TaxID=34282 RepID=A0A7J9CKA0_GOSGO|nr:hypothetical protein [Gossypium gossypioides]
MKSNTSPALAVLTLLLLLSLFLSTGVNTAHASTASSKAKGSSSQGLGNLRPDHKRNPQKLVGSSFRRIPPSTSNPIQNK